MLCLIHKGQSLYTDQGNENLFRESHRPNEYTVWAELRLYVTIVL